MKKNKKIYFAYIIFLVSSTILVYCIISLYNWDNDNKKINKETKEIKKIIKNNNINIPEEKASIFDTLLKENSDTIALIKVNNTNIDYPVVQGNDNDYYLHHSFKKEENDAGWIFMDYKNKDDFDNKNTIIYGHSRLDKSMFGTLKYTLTEEWFNDKNNHIINIITKKETLKYQVFSSYAIETENYYLSTNFKDNNEFSTFLDTIKRRSIFNYNIEINSNDKILTLSTCNGKSKKTVVHAKLIK